MMQWNLVCIGSVVAAAAIWQLEGERRREERGRGTERDRQSGAAQRRERARAGVLWGVLINNEGGTVAAAAVVCLGSRELDDGGCGAFFSRFCHAMPREVECREPGSRGRWQRQRGVIFMC